MFSETPRTWVAAVLAGDGLEQAANAAGLRLALDSLAGEREELETAQARGRCALRHSGRGRARAGGARASLSARRGLRRVCAAFGSVACELWSRDPSG